MLTYKELIELREKLANGEIALELAKELYWKDYKEEKRSWHLNDWKNRRTQVIKDKCEICSSVDTLTLQHLSHPKKYYEYEKEVTNKYAQSFVNSNTFIDKSELSEHIIKNYDYLPVALCPNCEGRKPNKRMTKFPTFLCTKCRHEFEEPIYKSADNLVAAFYENEECFESLDKCFVSKDKWRNHHSLSQVKYWLQREKAKAEDVDKIEKEAFLLYLDDNIKYLSFEDSITACKKCAYSFDLNNMELCPKCNEYYKGVRFPTCIQCLPEEKRKTALNSIEFGKEMRAMHERLGIE
jgi:ribosomal protein L37AE/L43A